MTAKPKATHIPTFIDPPPSPMPGVDDPGLLGEWIAFRDDMDDLEASLNVDHPGLDWSEAMQPVQGRGRRRNQGTHEQQQTSTQGRLNLDHEARAHRKFVIFAIRFRVPRSTASTSFTTRTAPSSRDAVGA